MASESTPKQPAAAAPNGAVGFNLTVPCHLNDLPTPQEVADYARERADKSGLGTRRLREVVDDLKLQYYFGGRCIHYMRTDKGIVVWAAGRIDSPAYGEQLEAVPAELRRQLALTVPYMWNDEFSVIMAQEQHEG